MLLIMGGLLAWGVIGAARSWWYGRELALADQDMSAGRYEPALDRLKTLKRRRPDDAEVLFGIGVCAARLGRIDEALEAWTAVPRDSELSPAAGLERARLALDHGRLAVAEDTLAPLLQDPGPIGDQAGRLADQLDLFAGRTRAILRRIERRWANAPDPSALLRLHWQVETQPFPLLAMREALDRMRGESPDDDRVWLGQAALATRTGRLADADLLLTLCEGRRPDDLDVRRARLAWALEFGRSDEVRRAAARLPASALEPADRALLAARFAALASDGAGRLRALEQLAELRPGDPSVWEWLAEAAARSGDRARTAEYRGRKERIDRLLDEYRMLMGAVGAGDVSRTAELASAAEALGRSFEARGWWTILNRRDPANVEAQAALARLREPPGDPSHDGRTLADLLPPASARPADSSSSPGAQPVIPVFRDDAAQAGLTLVYRNDPTPLCRLPETMGGGVGLIDYDGDGRLDVYAVQGGHLPDVSPPGPQPQGDRLYRNQGDGTFIDVTARAGLLQMAGGYGHGVAVADFDNDGHPDLFVTRWRSYALYRNRGDGTFEDVTVAAGLGGPRDWPTSSAFADLDGDGDLDLYVCHYTAWDPVKSPPCPHPTDPSRHGYCVPRSLAAMPDHLFRNDGGRFVDVSDAAGVTAADRDGRGLGVVAAHLDDDGRIDLFVANDMTANLFFRNKGSLRFEETAAESGVATNAEGGYLAGMGIAVGDLDRDGRDDLVVTNFYGESSTFYRNLGGGQFADATSAVGLAAATRHVLGFGVAFIDANNDGWLDLAQANGHVNDYRPSIPFAMPAQLFLGTSSGRLVEVSGSAGSCWGQPRLGRGLAAGDLDNDGRADAVIVAAGEPPGYFHNQGPARHFVTLELEGLPPGSSRDAIGARVRVTAGGRTQVAQRFGGGSFLSAGDHRLHFGLGDAARIEAVEVQWPSGRVSRHPNLAADTGYRIREGCEGAEVLPGWHGGARPDDSRKPGGSGRR